MDDQKPRATRGGLIAGLRSPLLRQSFWLMVSTGVMGTYGFLFWLIEAHRYPPATIGVVTALISVITFLSAFCLLGLNIAVINHIPKHKDPSSVINSASIIVVVATVVPAVVFCLVAGSVSPHLAMLSRDWVLIGWFVVFAALATLDTLIEGVLIAFKDTFAVLVKNTLISGAKLVLAVALTGGIGSLFFAYYAGMFISPLMSYPYLAWKFRYRLRAPTSVGTYRAVMSSSLGNYVESIGSVLPPAVIAILIAGTLGAASTAYFYIAMTISVAIYTVPRAVGRNLIAQLAGDQGHVRRHVAHGARVMAMLTLPLVALVVVFGRVILGVFGPSYAANGYELLVLLALSAVVTCVNCLYWAVLNSRRETNRLVWVNLSGMTLTILLSFAMVRLGLTGIGLAWAGGQLSQLGFYYFTTRRSDSYRVRAGVD